MFCKKVVFKNFTKFIEISSVGVLFLVKLQACNFVKKYPMKLSSDFSEIFKNIYFYKTPPVAASVFLYFILQNISINIGYINI